MKPKQWDAFLTYLDILQRKTNRVLREENWEYLQYPDDREDFRDEIDRKFFAERMAEALSTLTTRERSVLTNRFGLGDGVPKSLDECAIIWNVGRERIRQIEGRALRKMRHPKRKNSLLEPEELKKREEQRLKEEKEEKRLEWIEAEKRREKNRLYKLEQEEKKRLRQIAHDAWWESEGKAQHEAREAKRQVEYEAAREDARRRHRAQFEVQQAEQLKRISEHNTHCKEMLAYQQMLIDRQLEARRKAREEDERIEEERREMGCMKAVACELLKQVKAEQHRLSQKPIAVKAIENNDTRPYIWDSFKKKRVYINQKE
jgi:hypothetical protein